MKSKTDRLNQHCPCIVAVFAAAHPPTKHYNSYAFTRIFENMVILLQVLSIDHASLSVSLFFNINRLLQKRVELPGRRPQIVCRCESVTVQRYCVITFQNRSRAIYRKK